MQTEQFNYLFIETPRLVLRQWQPSDYEPFAQMSQDSEVMRYFPKHLTAEESRAMIEKSKAMLEKDSHGYWALESKDTSEFLGFVALATVQFECSFKGSMEIGWRLKKSAWGNGFASEGAQTLLRYGFEALGLSEIVSLTAQVNLRSSRVMERIGMKRNIADDFHHPKIASESPLSPHVLYRVTKDEWLASSCRF